MKLKTHLQWSMIALLVAALGGACDDGDDGDDGDQTGGGEVEGCAADEVTVAYLGTEDDRDVCEALPDACAGVGDCGVQECISAMYALCEEPAFAVGCSDGASSTIISCNE